MKNKTGETSIELNKKTGQYYIEVKDDETDKVVVKGEE